MVPRAYFLTDDKKVDNSEKHYNDIQEIYWRKKLSDELPKVELKKEALDEVGVVEGGESERERE